MAASASQPLCQPCVYHEAFKGESRGGAPVYHDDVFLTPRARAAAQSLRCSVITRRNGGGGGGIPFQRADCSPPSFL